ncbi:MerR family transcriptional regulator [Streptomyces sp. NPDC059639]|uniref:MerR family transcriptional regulator n=1 Tax=Streptomyces sp. NPDC059639 TaxID=3346891 RepID=UPI00369EC679
MESHNFPIGELARRTGLTVKAIRFYSDTGIVVPACRTPAGYRLYGTDAVARLALVRTLRELGLDLPTIRRVVVDREVSMAQVAAAHAEALDVQIRTLRLRRSMLTAAARRGSTPEELDLMHRLATLSDAERRRLVDDFLATVFEGLDTHPVLAGVMRSLTPELPDDPSAEQIQAWAELAELLQDTAFRTRLHAMAEDLAGQDARTGPLRVLAEEVRRLAGPALDEGVAPTDPGAGPVVTALVTQYARSTDRPDDPGLRRRLAAHLEDMNDPRRDDYLRLLAVVNAWPAPESLAPVLEWSVRALTASAP